MKKLKYFFVFFIFLFNFIFSLKSIVIFVHGAFSDGSEDELKCRKSLEQQAQHLNIGDVIFFRWEQKWKGITHYERTNAALELAKFIFGYVIENEDTEDYRLYGIQKNKLKKCKLHLKNEKNETPDNKKYNEKNKKILQNKNFTASEPITIVGVGYGGQIAKLATQILGETADEFLGESIEIAQRELDRMKVKIDFKKTISAILNFKEQISKYQTFIKNLVAKRYFFDQRFLIETIITLGAANVVADYNADMCIVRKLYNYYSLGDFEQLLVGDRKLPAPKHNRAVNLRVVLDKCSGCYFWPKHSNMTIKHIIKWVLLIAYEFIYEKIDTFADFTFKDDGVIKFSKRSIPKYKKDPIFSLVATACDYLPDVGNCCNSCWGVTKTKWSSKS